MRKSGGGTELLITNAAAQAPEPPEDPPARSMHDANCGRNGDRGWGEIRALRVRRNRNAGRLAPSSALKPEVDGIAAASTDPRNRAMLALRLVQDKIRHLALAMGEGGHVPASADETWSRKFGDCK